MFYDIEFVNGQQYEDVFFILYDLKMYILNLFYFNIIYKIVNIESQLKFVKKIGMYMQGFQLEEEVFKMNLGFLIL